MPFDLKLYCGLALQHKMVTQQQLAEVMRLPEVQQGKIGEVLLAKQWISKEQHDWLNQAEAYYRAQREQGGAPAATAATAAATTATATAAAAAKRPTNLEQRQQLVELDVSSETPLELDAASLSTGTSARASYRHGHDGETEAAKEELQAKQARAPQPVAAAAAAAVVAVEPPTPNAPAQARAAATSSIGHQAAVLTGRENQRVHALLAEAIKAGASDLHLHATLPPLVRIHGTLRPLEGQKVLTAAETEPMARSILTEHQWSVFSQKWDIDFAYSVEGLGRFRSNAYRQQRGVDVVFRVIPPKPPTLADLGLPADLAKFTEFHQGLILCTGPAGCGKSTTMAALLDVVNESRSDHILTIEDPVEFIHASKKCLVRQRQVNSHTESFARALRAALREDPDVIAIGELRDLETIQLALSAAETGHLVIGTLHTNSAVRTINRVLGVFPPSQQAQIRVMFSESLRGVISQKLVPRADGTGRVAALEVLMVNHAVGNLIRDEKQFQIRTVMQMNRKQGMRLLDDSLKDLVKAGVIKKEDAKLAAENPASLDG